MKVVIDKYNRFLSKVFEQRFVHYLVNEMDEPNLEVHIGMFFPNLKDTAGLDDYYYMKKDYLYCRHIYKLAKWRVEISGFEEKTVLKIDSNAFGWWVFPGGTIPALLMFKFLQKGFVMLHASAVARNNKAYIFTGRSGVGKTITVMNLLKMGFDYLGDDTVIVGKNKALSFIKPLNIRFTYNVREMLGITFNLAERREIFLKNALKILTFGYIGLFTKVHPNQVFAKKLGDIAELDTLFFITQADHFSIEKIQDKERLVRQMCINIKMEDELSTYLLAYIYCFPNSWMASFWKKAREIIKESIKEKTYLMEMPKEYSYRYLDLILEKVNENI